VGLVIISNLNRGCDFGREEFERNHAVSMYIRHAHHRWLSLCHLTLESEELRATGHVSEGFGIYIFVNQLRNLINEPSEAVHRLCR